MLSKILKDNLVPSEDFIYGFADLHGLIGKRFEDYSYGISIGKRLDGNIVDGIENGPTMEYYDHYKRINFELAGLALKIQAELGKIGIESKVIDPTISKETEGYMDYLKNLNFPMSHKMVATRAGLGWIGKTDLFISKAFGPRVRLVSLLLGSDPGVGSIPVEASKCGSCDICVSKCPANAANGKLWDIKTPREEFFDAFACREKCSEMSIKNLNFNALVCGLCVNVCPMGKEKQ